MVDTVFIIKVNDVPILRNLPLRIFQTSLHLFILIQNPRIKKKIKAEVHLTAVKVFI